MPKKSVKKSSKKRSPSKKTSKRKTKTTSKKVRTQNNSKKTRNPKSLLYWTPRILGILYVAFIALFAFAEPIISANFLIQIIPSAVIALLLFFSWKHEKYGGIIFLALALIFTFYFKTYQTIEAFTLLALPLYIIGILFILNQNPK